VTRAKGHWVVRFGGVEISVGNMTESNLPRRLFAASCAFVAVGLSVAPSLATPPAKNAPQAIRLQWRHSAENSCYFGPEIEAYFDRARANLEQQMARDPTGGDQNDLASARVNRRWGGVTITAVVVGYETTDIYFADPLPRLLAQARRAGPPIIKRREGSSLIYDREVVSGFTSATEAYERRYGQSIWFCGN
jgi:hypothetical protein